MKNNISFTFEIPDSLWFDGQLDLFRQLNALKEAWAISNIVQNTSTRTISFLRPMDKPVAIPPNTPISLEKIWTKELADSLRDNFGIQLR